MTASSNDIVRAIRLYLAHEIGFDEFEALFTELFLNLIPEGTLTEGDLSTFGAINEKLMWTADGPNHEERSVGWIDRREFRSWLAEWGRRYDL